MKAGVLIPWRAQYQDYATVLRNCKLAEALGYDIIWFSDHIIMPLAEVDDFSRCWYEPITLMANVAAHVTKVRLGTNVLVVPYRPPILSARMLTTLDVVSGGRLIIGVGTGFMKEEFDALGAEFDDRAGYTEECIRLWKTLWGDSPVSFEGRYVRFRDMVFDPKPKQKPHPPIWVGNRGRRVIRRVAALGDGWHPVDLTWDELRDSIDYLREAWDEAGRSGAPTISFGGTHGAVGGSDLPEEDRRILVGSIRQVTRDAVRLKEVGCANLVFRLGIKEGDPDSFARQLETIATKVLPEVR